jgi:hypothetical protein
VPKMKIRIDSNFVLPGMEGVDEIDLNLPHIKLREVLEELTLRSSGRVKFIRPMTDFVDPMDFLIEINGLPNSGSKEALEMGLNEGDLVIIKLSPLGGG